MNTHRLTAAGLLAASAFALTVSACAEDEPTPRVENRPTQTETTAAAEPETAEAFIRRWFKTSEDMQNTGDTTEYLAMSKNCSNCQKTAKRIESYYGAGGSVSFKGHAIKSIGPYLDNDSRFLVESRVGPTEYATASAAPTENYEGGSENYVVTVGKLHEGWQVTEVTVLVK